MERSSWSNKLEYHLSFFSYVVGLSSFWRFTYLTIEHGGAPFLYAYLLLFLLVGIPLVYLDLAWGQYSNLSPFQAFKVVPALQGAGICITILSFVVSIYFGVFSYYLFIYLTSSFSNPFPWRFCTNEWNSDNCNGSARPICMEYENVTVNENITLSPNSTAVPVSVNTTVSECVKYSVPAISSAAIDYWKHISANDDFCTNLTESTFATKLLGPDWSQTALMAPLSLCAIFVAVHFVLTIVSLSNHVNLTGKMSYLFSTAPFAVSVMVFVRCITLDGAFTTFTTLFVPNSIEEFIPAKLWKDAMSQVFISLMVTYGGLQTWSSYNKFYNKFQHDSVVLLTTTPLLSCLFASTCYAVIGHLNFTHKGSTISSVVESIRGPMSPLVLLSEALNKMWGYELPWSCGVLVTLMLSSVATQLPALETIISSISDSFKIFSKLWLRDIVVMVIVLLTTATYLLLPCYFKGFGMQLILTLDTLVFPFSFILISCFVLLMICYSFGFKLLGTNTKAMTRSNCFTNLFWFIVWGVICPIILFACLAYTIYEVIISGITAMQPTSGILAHDWLILVTCCSIGFLVFLLAVCMLVAVIRSPGNFKQKLSYAFSAQPHNSLHGNHESNGALLSNGGGTASSPSTNHVYLSGYSTHNRLDGDEILVDNDIVTSV